MEGAGVEFDLQMGVKVNKSLQTTNKNIFAVGDCCAKYKVFFPPIFLYLIYIIYLHYSFTLFIKISFYLRKIEIKIIKLIKIFKKKQFTHVADFMARMVIRNAFFFGNGRFETLIIPWAIYTSPELAHVGLYPKDLIKKKIAFDVYERSFAEVDRAKLEEEEEGFVRIYTRKGEDKILGCTIVAPNAGDMISEVTLAITNGIGLASIAVTIHPYPTLSDSIRQIGDMYNRSRLTPTVRTLFRKLFTTYRKV